MDTPTDDEVIDAIDEIAYQTEIEAQWLVLGHATDEQIYKAIGKLPTTHVVILIRRLIDRGYLNER